MRIGTTKTLKMIQIALCSPILTRELSWPLWEVQLNKRLPTKKKARSPKTTKNR